MEVQSGSRQFLLYGGYEAGHVGISAALRLVQLVLNVVIGLRLEVFQTEVFQFALQFVKSQFVGEWGI